MITVPTTWQLLEHVRDAIKLVQASRGFLTDIGLAPVALEGDQLPEDDAPYTLVLATDIDTNEEASTRSTLSSEMDIVIECAVPFAVASDSQLQAHRARFDASVSVAAARLPFADRSVDVIVCSQLLHHFADGDARGVIAELHRVARRGVVISDLRRSWLAAGGFWIASLALGFHPITRHDGVVSVLRGFTTAELRELTRSVTGVTPTMRRGMFWRVSATWRPIGR